MTHIRLLLKDVPEAFFIYIQTHSSLCLNISVGLNQIAIQFKSQFRQYRDFISLVRDSVSQVGDSISIFVPSTKMLHIADKKHILCSYM